MQISRLLPLLIDLLESRNKQNKPVNQPETTSKLESQALKKATQTELSNIKNIQENNQTAHIQNKNTQVLPDFVPLPVKTTLFEESSFYIRNQKEGSGQTGQPSKTEVLISIRTKNIGMLWISITAIEESLKIIIYTEEELYTSRLKDTLAALAKELPQLGYSSVNAQSITRPDIKSCRDIICNLSPTQFYLINQEV